MAVMQSELCMATGCVKECKRTKKADGIKERLVPKASCVRLVCLNLTLTLKKQCAATKAG